MHMRQVYCFLIIVKRENYIYSKTVHKKIRELEGLKAEQKAQIFYLE